MIPVEESKICCLLKQIEVFSQNYDNYKREHIENKQVDWTDARRPVPRLWIRSAEVRRGASLGEWEHNNKQVV